MSNIKKVVGPILIPMASFERRQSLPKKPVAHVSTESVLKAVRMYQGKARNGIVIPRKPNS